MLHSEHGGIGGAGDWWQVTAGQVSHTCISSDSPEQRLHTEVLLDKRLQRFILTGDTLEPVDLVGREGGGWMVRPTDRQLAR